VAELSHPSIHRLERSKTKRQTIQAEEMKFLKAFGISRKKGETSVQ